MRIHIMEYLSEIKCCRYCQTEDKGVFPTVVCNRTQYGKNIKSLGVYLSQYQLIPFHRSAELIEALTGHRVSVGTLVGNNQYCKEQLSDFGQALKENLLYAPLVNSDETGFYYEGKRK